MSSIHIRIDFNEDQGISAHIEPQEGPTSLPAPSLTTSREEADLPRPTIDPRAQTPDTPAPTAHPRLGKSGIGRLPAPSSDMPGLPQLRRPGDDKPPRPRHDPITDKDL